MPSAITSRLRDPVAEQAVGVLATVREPQRDARHAARQRRRQRALRADGEDDGGVEARRGEGARPARARRLAAASSAPSPWTHGAAKTIAPSTSSRKGTAAAPDGDASKRDLARRRRPARSAAIAGVAISTSPRLSRRTTRRRRTPRQARRRMRVGAGFDRGARDRAHDATSIGSRARMQRAASARSAQRASRRADRRELPLGLVADVEQDRAAAGTVTRLDVVEDVADHPARARSRRCARAAWRSMPGRGLAAQAADRAARAAAHAGNSRASDLDAALVANASAQRASSRRIRAASKRPRASARLVGDDDRARSRRRPARAAPSSAAGVKRRRAGSTL